MSAAWLDQPAVGEVRKQPTAERDDLGALQKAFQPDVALRVEARADRLDADTGVGRLEVSEPVRCGGESRHRRARLDGAMSQIRRQCRDLTFQSSMSLWGFAERLRSPEQRQSGWIAFSPAQRLRSFFESEMSSGETLVLQRQCTRLIDEWMERAAPGHR